jgi:ADP-ribosylglycohydrolase
MIRTYLFDRLAAGLKSQAVADAAGDQYEFQAWPNPGSVTHSLMYGEPKITDDTQMAMFTIEGMCEALEEDANYPHYLPHIEKAYLRWLTTQEPTAHLKTPVNEARAQSIADLPVMQQVMAPGTTCLKSLRLRMAGKTVFNDRIGCGTVMRQLPFAMMDGPLLAVESALLTHTGDEIPEATVYLWNYMQDLLGTTMPVSNMDGCPASWAQGGWTAMSCAEMAVYSLESSVKEGKPHFIDAARRAICHSGDSDSVAAVTGALYGWHTVTYPVAQYAKLEVASTLDALLLRFKAALQLIAGD